MSNSEEKEIYVDIFNDTATITIYSDTITDSSIIEISKIFEIIFPEFKISYLSMVKDELFITFPLPKGWSQKEVKIIAEDISTRL